MFNSSIRTLLLSKTTIPLSRESGIRGYEISYNNTVNGVKNHCLQDYIVHQRCSITVLNWNRPMEGLSFREFSQIRSNTRKRQEIKKIKGDDFFIREKRKENSARKDEKRKIKQEINKRINARKKFKAEKHATKPQSRINIKHAITAHKEWVTGQSEQSVKKEEPSKSRSKDKNARSTPIEKDPKQKKDSKREKKVSTKEEKSKVTKEKIPPRVKEETANPTEPIQLPKDLVVKSGDVDMRLDRFVQKYLPGVPNALIQKLIREKDIMVCDSEGSTPRKPIASEKTILGQIVQIRAKELTLSPKKENKEFIISAKDEARIKSMVIYQDDNIIALNKPSGLPAQGGSGITDYIDKYLDCLKFGYDERPKLVHRLDKDSSGVLLLARTRGSAVHMQKLFREGNGIQKIYWALISGKPDPMSGRIKVRLEKSLVKGEEKVVVKDEPNGTGKMSITQYKTLKGTKDISLVALYPGTGRTHQLRVICASVLKLPIIGDPKYGSSSGFDALTDAAKKLHLHAKRLTFPDIQNPSKMIEISAPVPPHMEEMFNIVGFPSEESYDDSPIVEKIKQRKK